MYCWILFDNLNFYMDQGSTFSKVLNVFFSFQTSTLSSEETLEALQNCLDPSILSIFEEAPTIEVRLHSSLIL